MNRQLLPTIILRAISYGMTCVIPTTLVATWTGVVLSGCSSEQINESDPASLFKEAEEDIKSDHFLIALERLRNIKNKFPYSNFAVDAQLRIADVYFLQESFAEAAASYESFKDLHPKHEKAPYAAFKAAKSYLNDSPGTVARDLTSTHKALAAYENFLRRYPFSSEAEEAKKDIQTIKETLAEKELTIGDFYFKRDFFISAKHRYEKVLKLYPETQAAKAAQVKLNQMESAAK